MKEQWEFRATFWLPAAAAVAGIAMVALATVALHAVRQRYQLALDGRVLGLAHRVESLLRERAVENAASSLDEPFREASPEVAGMVLHDSRGIELVRLGRTDGTLRSRKVTIFLGPHGRGGPPSSEERSQRLRQLRNAPGTAGSSGLGPPWARGDASRTGTTDGRAGRGRYVLEVFLAPHAGRPPLATRLILPAAVAGSLALVALALVAGRLLDRQRELVLQEAQQRRSEALGRAGAGLAHQLRTPLATIKGSLQMIAEEATGERPARRARAAIAQAERMERMLGLLLDYARPPEPEPEEVEVAGLLDELATGRDDVRTGVTPGLRVVADREHLLQILENLVDNALAASPGDASVEITVRPEGRLAVFVVADRGPGPGEDPEELFEPYVTGRADGTGLGLPIARNLAEGNGGSLELRPRTGGGTEAILRLPLAGGGA
ncbi:MAG: HAMP domain-containing histidine kinase [Acidobacteria bacterium]|nr:HAMP domain-containing histidine kinase [Acidobacteriota bacterium]